MKPLLLALLLTLPMLGQADPFTPFRADYEVFHGSSSLGGGYYHLEQLSDNRYRMGYQSDVSFLLLSDVRTETSVFERQDNDVLKPLNYRMDRKGSGPDFGASIQFEGSEIVAKYKKRQKTFPMRSPVFDNLLYQQQLRLDVAAGKTDMHYPLIQKTSERNHYYRVIGEEEVTIPDGTATAIRVERIREAGDPKRTVIWFLPQMNYVVARLAHFEDGDLKADMRLQKVEFY
ncbi:conserved hypothetical protein [Ferrimonas balearica DSM 9799]|uniref:DUF3108 domain-containing protein n=1 Tax=Ferrimonas balearica (strain DSM 9799 / CCM 4581 / KCTC 23876 / PAT) TaxID=550540 RepID=E1SLA8_FERBD|nr:DUF3108 domain-containing protein [Ferrimonas balearica]ADN76472.1 conserved hypothetical protein [Ferrimonas balearica DSM 9799]MBW3163039.1 DUF3108 domain-containing protein [Ferrimonas balearica]MBY5980731.1 DUF3108 domain-containing protein [Ferrimonas balearica]